MRGFQEDEFMNKLLDSMSFQAFVIDRGSPYRVCDLFDDVTICPSCTMSPICLAM